MHILISNDDGVKAQGINFLRSELSKEYNTTTIAPNTERSGCGHGLTLGAPIRVDQVSENVFSCSGYPADCVLVGIGHILKDQRPDLIVSGINHGANLGQDRFYSGTMAAAREAAFRGIPAIGLSLVTKGLRDVEHFETVCYYISKLLEMGIHKHIPPMCVLNINAPNIPLEEVAGLKVTNSGFQQYSEEVIERVDARNKKYYWIGGTYDGHKDIQGSDGNAVEDKYISVTIDDLASNSIGEDPQRIELLTKLKVEIEKLNEIKN